MKTKILLLWTLVFGLCGASTYSAKIVLWYGSNVNGVYKEGERFHTHCNWESVYKKDFSKFVNNWTGLKVGIDANRSSTIITSKAINGNVRRFSEDMMPQNLYESKEFKLKGFEKTDKKSKISYIQDKIGITKQEIDEIEASRKNIEQGYEIGSKVNKLYKFENPLLKKDFAQREKTDYLADKIFYLHVLNKRLNHEEMIKKEIDEAFSWAKKMRCERQ